MMMCVHIFHAFPADFRYDPCCLPLFADLHMVKIDLWVLQQQQQVFKLDHHKFANGCKHGGRLQICAEKFNEDDKGGVKTNYPNIIIKENPC